MNKKNYRTLEGIYNALLPIVNSEFCDCHIEKNRKTIQIYGKLYHDQPLFGCDIELFLPVLKDASWMVRHNLVEDRVELLVWLSNGTI